MHLKGTPDVTTRDIKMLGMKRAIGFANIPIFAPLLAAPLVYDGIGNPSSPSLIL
jgi:hypothetical protein